MVFTACTTKDTWNERGYFNFLFRPEDRGQNLLWSLGRRGWFQQKGPTGTQLSLKPWQKREGNLPTGKTWGQSSQNIVRLVNIAKSPVNQLRTPL